MLLHKLCTKIGLVFNKRVKIAQCPNFVPYQKLVEMYFSLIFSFVPGTSTRIWQIWRRVYRSHKTAVPGQDQTFKRISSADAIKEQHKICLCFQRNTQQVAFEEQSKSPLKFDKIDSVPHFRLIVTDGVFSMDGNVCPLPQIKQLADRSNILLGVLRQTKRRTPQKVLYFDKSIVAGMELQSSLTNVTQLDSLEKLVAEPRYLCVTVLHKFVSITFLHHYNALLELNKP